MGFGRSIGTIALSCMALTGATAQSAPVLRVSGQVASYDPSDTPVASWSPESASQPSDADPQLDAFTRAIGAALQADRANARAHCQGEVPADSRARMAWEASCRYSRR